MASNTGTSPLLGVFSNLAQGQQVSLDYAGITYSFVANYFGGSGNDLVLQWANTRLLAWGYNSNGQLGNGSTAASLVPGPVDMAGVLWNKTLLTVATGGSRNLALCADGTLAAWGNANSSGSRPVLLDQPGVIAGKTVVALAVGGNHNLALCSDGSIAAWGDNNSGQLGNNSTLSSSIPVLVDASGALSGKIVTAISAGSLHSLALCSDGTVVAWGSNASGQLGNASIVTISKIPVMVTSGGDLAGKTIVAIAAGISHSLVHCADGMLGCFQRCAH